MYLNLWIGLLSSGFMLGAVAFGILPFLEGWAALLVSAHLMTFALANRGDDYFKALCQKGFSFAGATFALWLIVQGILTVGEGGYGVGMTAAGATPTADDVSFFLPDWLNNAYLLAAVASVAFFGGALGKHMGGSR